MDKNKHVRSEFSTRTTRQHAIVTKLVKDPTQARSYDADNNRKSSVPPTSVLNAVSDRTTSITRDLESMEQLLPDIELAAQILVSSILSPKDMGAPNLTFNINSTFEDDELGGKLLKVVSEYFTKDYKINDELSEILHDILFKKGAYARMIIPESSLDQLINENGRVTMESFKGVVDPATMSVKSLGILGDVSTSSNRGSVENSLSMESLFSTEHDSRPPKPGKIGSHITVIDNPDAMKMPRLYDKIRKDKTQSKLASNFMTMEARKNKEDLKNKKENKEKATILKYGNSDREIEQSLDKNRPFGVETVVEIKNKYEADREMVGHPLVSHLAIEAVIPAHTPGNPKAHIGYFVLLDQFGNPISTSAMTDHYRDLQASFSEGKKDNEVSAVLTELRGNMVQADSGNKVETINAATRSFAEIIEKNLLERMRNGIGHDSVELARPNEIYQIMLSRACKRKHTQMMYVPAELMSYMAFYFNNQGVGESILEKSRVLGSIRIILMFANTMAAIRNSSSRTELGIQIDPNDTDPMATISQIKDSFMRSRSEQYPLGEGDPSAIVNYLQQAGVDVVYSGHPGLPDMKVETTEKSGGKVQIDRDLEETLRHQQIMSMGLSPESVDASTEVDFATTLVNTSLLLSKRVALYQKLFESQKTDFCRKFTENSEILISKLLEIIETNGDADAKKDPMTVVDMFIRSFEVELPKPDSVTLEAQMEAFNQYSESIETAINAWISDEFAMSDAEGDISDYLDETRAAIKAHYERRWLRENNVFPELEEITEVDEKGNPVFDFAEVQSKHMDAIFGSMREYMNKARKASFDREIKDEERERLEDEMRAEIEAKIEAEQAAKEALENPEPEEGGDDEENTDDIGGGSENEDTPPEENEEEVGDGEGEGEADEEATLDEETPEEELDEDGNPIVSDEEDDL